MAGLAYISLLLSKNKLIKPRSLPNAAESNDVPLTAVNLSVQWVLVGSIIMSVSGGVVGKHSALIFNPWLAEIQTGDNNIY